LQRKIITTADGSKTIYLPEWDEHYHSKHGAIQEAYHVFIKMGLEHLMPKKELSILEIGFGTGLNAIITLIEAENHQLKIDYQGVEAYPVFQTFLIKRNLISFTLTLLVLGYNQNYGLKLFFKKCLRH